MGPFLHSSSPAHGTQTHVQFPRPSVTALNMSLQPPDLGKRAKPLLALTLQGERSHQGLLMLTKVYQMNTLLCYHKYKEKQWVGNICILMLFQIHSFAPCSMSICTGSIHPIPCLFTWSQSVDSAAGILEGMERYKGNLSPLSSCRVPLHWLYPLKKVLVFAEVLFLLSSWGY